MTRSLSAVTMSVRTDIRREWRSLVIIALFTSLTLACSMTAAIGARRSATAWENFLERTRTPHAAIEVPIAETQALVDGIRGQPGVVAVAAAGFISVHPETYEPGDDLPIPGGLTGLTPGFGTDVYRPIILEGRSPDPTRIDEFTVNQAMADLAGLRPGDEVVLVSSPPAVRQAATVVGIHVAPFDVSLGPGHPVALLTPAFGARWFDEYVAGLSPEYRAGYHDFVGTRLSSPDVAAELFPDGFLEYGAFGTDIATALDAERAAFALLAVVTAFGAIVALGQAAVRRVRRTAAQAPTLAALGLGPTARSFAIGGAPAVAFLVGASCGPLIAFAASPLTGRWAVGHVDPQRGRVVDVAVMSIGAVAAATVLIAVSIGAAWGASRGVNDVLARPTAIRLATPSALFGGHVAVGWARRVDRTIARSHVVGVSFGVALIVATVAWAATADHVVSTPASYGATFDAIVSPASEASEALDPTQLDGVITELDRRPEIGAVLGRGVAGMTVVESGRAEVLIVDEASDWWPIVVRGRTPRFDNEVLVGAGLLGGARRVGDEIEIDGRPFTIVGEQRVPALSNGVFGETATVRSGALAPEDLGEPTAVALVGLRAEVAPSELASSLGDGVLVRSLDDLRPVDLDNLSRTGALARLLVVVCILFGLAALANGVVAATGARRADHATLRAIGADGSLVAGTVRWHTAIVTALGSTIGLPLGLIAGAAIWRSTAARVAVGAELRDPATVAAWVWGGAVVGAVVIALTTGAAAARRSRRFPAGE